jgi:predicted metal-binding membrane protein
MDRIQKIILISILSIAGICWVFSIDQPDMMKDMMRAIMLYDPISISLFTITWTVGMAAMMFPSITPMVLHYNKLIKTGSDDSDNTGEYMSSLVVEGNDTPRRKNRSLLLPIFHGSLNVIFVGSYLAIWAIIGIALLLAWSIPMNNFLTQQQFHIAYGIILIISGVYQFSSLKINCLGCCQSPKILFMERWSNGGVSGALKIGTYHGLYCLGCCWPYFLLMVALGWMNLLWMALFAAIIFGEKIWIRGARWITRSAGAGFIILGVLVLLGIIEIPTMMEMNMGSNEGDNDMQMNMDMKDNDMQMNMDMKDNDMQMNMDMKDNNMGMNMK